MPTLPNMPLTTPTVGGSSGAWGTLLAAVFSALDTHRHEGIGNGGLKIRPTGIDINADLTYAGNQATNLGGVAFTPVSALASGLYVLFTDVATGDLYWRTFSGTNVRLTNGTSLNVSGFIGGIGGDYTAVSAALNYDDSQLRYTLRQGGGTTWARISSGELRLHETSATTSIYVGLASPTGMVSPYVLTLPAAPPGAKSLVQVSAAGVMTFENTGVESVTMATNAHVTVSGTGEFKHGDRELSLHSFSGMFDSGWQTNTGGYVVSNASGTLMVSVPLKVGDRAKSVSFLLLGNGVADLTTTVYHLDAAMMQTSKGATTSTNPAAAWAVVTINITDTTLATREALTIEFAANATGIAIGTIAVTYDRP